MNARDSATGDGSADAGNAAPDQPDPYERQIEALERTIKEHTRAHAARIETLNRQSEGYLSTLEEERKLLVETRERFRRGEATDGTAASDAEALKG